MSRVTSASSAERQLGDRQKHRVLLLRWVLIIATSYLVLFNGVEVVPTAGMGLFVAGYFASNVLLGSIWSHVASRRRLLTGIILFDTFAASAGLALTGNVSSDFFLLFFLIMFLGAVTDRLEPALVAAVLSSVAYLFTVAEYESVAELLRGGYLVRVPFLFVVALFFGHLAQEEKQSRRQARAEFLATVSHDLKQPAGVIQSVVDLLLNEEGEPLSEGQRHLLARVRRNCRRVVALSSNLLDASRIEEGAFALERRPVDLAEIVATMLPLSGDGGNPWGIALRFAREEGLPRLSIDPAQMERVVANLVDNAIKYSPVGGEISVAIRADGGDILLTVEDSGSGIPRDELPELFEKYHRTPGSSVGGAGLGLYIVRRIVEAHGGSVGVESAVGRGTRFTVRLPVHGDLGPASGLPRWGGSRWRGMLRRAA